VGKKAPLRHPVMPNIASGCSPAVKSSFPFSEYIKICEHVATAESSDHPLHAARNMISSIWNTHNGFLHLTITSGNGNHIKLGQHQS
jgi:hypothetical protein